MQNYQWTGLGGFIKGKAKVFDGMLFLRKSGSHAMIPVDS